LVALVLFGSRARGDHRSDSDWDILVVAHDLPDKVFARHLFLKRALPDPWRGKVTLLAKTPAEFEAHISPLYLDIALDGVLLYDHNDYMRHKLDALRHLIQEKHLHREQRGHELIWHADPPSADWQLTWNHAG
jgi:predicted nucleotidyltransferase